MAAQPTLTERLLVANERYFVLKRILDVTLALMLLALLLPVMLIVALLIALDSP